MPRLSTLAKAAQSPTTHRFDVRRRQYLEYLPTEVLIEGGCWRKLCDPPLGTADGSLHRLRSPRGKLVDFQWRKRGRVWMALDLMRSNRLGYLPTYLSSHGWVYTGPTPPETHN